MRRASPFRCQTLGVDGDVARALDSLAPSGFDRGDWAEVLRLAGVQSADRERALREPARRADLRLASGWGTRPL